MSCRPIHCSREASYHTKPDPNPDISGIGVVVGFVTSGWATFLFLALRYIAAASKLQTESDRQREDLLDSSMRRCAWRLLGKWRPRPQLGPALESVVIAMSDQQLVTGLAIIISAYARLNCGMSVYHWRLIITVAWFSSSTHLATLLFLRQYLQRNRYIWYARVLLMTSLVVMLAVAIVATGAGEDALLMPAKCAYNHAGYWMYSSGNAIPMIFSNVIPLGGFLIRLIEMSSTVKRLSGGSLRTAIGKLWRRSLVWLCKKLGKAPRWAQVLFTPLVPLSLAFLVSMQVVLDFLASDSCGILWLLFTLVWGTMRVFRDRDSREEENQWTFGQLVPVLLLLLPVFLAGECFSEINDRTKGPALLTTENVDGENSPFRQSTDSREEVELMPTEGRDTSLTAPSGMTLDSTAPPPGYPSDTLYTHLHGLCIYDFRVESWYLDSLFLVMFFVIGLACIILPMVELGHVTAILQFFAFGGVLPFIILFFICVTAIPLCGVASIIRQGGTSHRRPSFILRLAIDPGVGYRVSRGLFFVYAPISSALFGGMSSRLFDFAAIVPGVWCLICAAIFCYASLSCLLSVYLEVFSGKA